MLWTKEAQRQGNCDDNDGGCVDPTVFHPAFGTFSLVVMGRGVYLFRKPNFQLFHILA